MDWLSAATSADTVSQGVNWETIIAFGAGAAVAVAAGFLPVWWDTRQQRTALRLAVRADISSLINHESTKSILKHLEEMLAQWDDEVDPNNILYMGRDDHIVLPIFEANLDKLGFLGPLIVEDVVVFYDLVQEIENHTSKYSKMDRDSLKMYVEKDLKGLKKITELGESLISRM